MNNTELVTDIPTMEMEMEVVNRNYPVIPNPEGTPTAELKTMEIDLTVYEVVDEAARTELGNKVDKIPGKGLSTEDFTTEEKNKLATIETGAEKNVQSDFAQNDDTKDDFIKNKPTKLSDFDNDEHFIDKSVDDLENYYKKSETYDKTAIDNALSGKADTSNTYTKSEVDTALDNKVNKDGNKVLSDNNYSDEDKTIVNGVPTALNGKVDKAEGYGLSENNFSDTDKENLDYVTAEIDNKLDKTETAVNANGLALVTPVTDTAPYIYRQTPVKESFKALMHKIVGASVVWNQLVDSNTTSVTIASGHRYIAKINGTLTFGTSDGTAITVSENDYFTDLTAMFGTTIADYVNTLETSQSGSGIAWLQSYGFFTEDYYAYKQNKLESGCVSAKKIVGTNQAKMDNANNPNRSSFSYTKETAQSIVGTKTVGGGNFFAQFEIDLISGKTYTFSFGKFKTNGTENANVNVYIYSDRLWGTSIKANWNVSKDGSTWTSTYNGKAYVGIFTTASVDTVLELDGFMASISGSTSFEPYTETTYPISPITLRGLFKLSTDKLTVDGDEYNADGSVTRNYEQRAYQSGDESLANAITDGTNTIVKLATPTTEESTPFTETEIVGSTEEFIDYEVAQSNRDVAIPVGTDTDYYQEMKLPPLPTTSGNHNLQYNPASGFSWS